MGCRVVDTHSNIVHKLEIEPKINSIQDLLYLYEETHSLLSSETQLNWLQLACYNAVIYSMLPPPPPPPPFKKESEEESGY